MNPEQVARMLGRSLLEVQALRGGGNSRVYRARCDDGTVFAVKSYPPRNIDPRDRLGAESGALRFLARRGENCVPAVVAVDTTANMAAFDWVEGTAVGASAAYVDEAMEFLSRLHRHAGHAEAAALPLASEACLSSAELLGQLDRRFSRLSAVEDVALNSFLLRSVMPLLETARHGAGDGELAPAHRTLSPSDFGFHNVLRRPDGRLAFIDFEYFGWDDPVKLTADTMLHPAMALDTAMKRQVADRAAAIYGGDRDFSTRLIRFYPLFALRWVAIICNEFLPERWAVRAHAGVADRQAVQARQLAKAAALLDQLPRDMTEILDAA